MANGLLTAELALQLAQAAAVVLLALVVLGLLQLGHETTPELVQLAAVALYLYGLAASPHRPWHGGVAAAGADSYFSLDEICRVLADVWPPQPVNCCSSTRWSWSPVIVLVTRLFPNGCTVNASP